MYTRPGQVALAPPWQLRWPVQSRPLDARAGLYSPEAGRSAGDGLVAELSAWLSPTRSPCQTDCLRNRCHLEETRGHCELEIKDMLDTEFHLHCSSQRGRPGPFLTQILTVGCVLMGPTEAGLEGIPEEGLSWGLLQCSWGVQPPAAISRLVHPLQVLNPHSHKSSLLLGSRELGQVPS